MKRWESLIDQKIREAMEQGEFDDLPGKGEPVDLAENAFEDPELRLGHRMLRNAGFAPSWIEERKEIDAAFELARTKLARAWTLFRKTRQHQDVAASAQARWEKSLSAFRQEAAHLNRMIAAWNLRVPAAGVQRRLIDAEKEIAEILRG